ncbi:MAG: TolC family protein, partial [Gemmatimonadetes bacterium]|nr:TolC family protein [Gemmatimonadota bacterium]
MAFDPRPTPGRRWWLAALALATLPFPARSQTLSLLEAADSALATHPSVLAARARVDEADAGRSAARASYLPDIVGTSSLARFEKPMVVAPLHGFDPRNPPAFDRTLVQSQIGASWTLFDGGARRAGVKGADAVRDAARAGERSSVEDLLESVAGAYVAVLSTREVRAAADRQV